MKCDNCKKEIKDFDTACKAKENDTCFCSLDCFTDYAHEYMGCEPLNEGEE